jgi:hypothetical protein
MATRYHPDEPITNRSTAAPLHLGLPAARRRSLADVAEAAERSAAVAIAPAAFTGFSARAPAERVGLRSATNAVAARRAATARRERRVAGSARAEVRVGAETGRARLAERARSAGAAATVVAAVLAGAMRSARAGARAIADTDSAEAARAAAAIRPAGLARAARCADVARARRAAELTGAACAACSSATIGAARLACAIRGTALAGRLARGGGRAGSARTSTAVGAAGLAGAARRADLHASAALIRVPGVARALRSTACDRAHVLVRAGARARRAGSHGRTADRVRRGGAGAVGEGHARLSRLRACVCGVAEAHADRRRRGARGLHAAETRTAVRSGEVGEIGARFVLDLRTEDGNAGGDEATGAVLREGAALLAGGARRCVERIAHRRASVVAARVLAADAVGPAVGVLCALAFAGLAGAGRAGPAGSAAAVASTCEAGTRRRARRRASALVGVALLAALTGTAGAAASVATACLSAAGGLARGRVGDLRIAGRPGAARVGGQGGIDAGLRGDLVHRGGAACRKRHDGDAAREEERKEGPGRLGDADGDRAHARARASS